RMIHEKSGALHFARYDVDPNKCINSIGRAALNSVVIGAAQQYPNVRVHFNYRCREIDVDAPTVHLVHTETGQHLTASAEAVVGVDGAFSAVRQSMQRRLDRFDYSQNFLEHGYKELTIPPASDG